MDIARVKESFSINYLQIISAAKQIDLERCYYDEDSTDVILKKTIYLDGIGKFNSSIRVQLKATSSLSQYEINNNILTYKLKVKNYNDLCMASTMPSILALLILPQNEEEWLYWTKEELTLRATMYWISLQNCSISENTGTVSIKIPSENILNPNTLENLLEVAAREGRL